jgi:hypothetical protein
MPRFRDTARALALLGLLGLLACSSPPRLDFSSDESAERSLAEVTAALGPEEKERFSNAFSVVVRHALGGGVLDVESSPANRQKLAAALDGKTAAEVIADAQKLEAQKPKDG